MSCSLTLFFLRKEVGRGTSNGHLCSLRGTFSPRTSLYGGVIMAKTKATADGLVVLLPWHRYGELNPNATAIRFNTLVDAQVESERDDDQIIVTTSLEEAAEVARMFEQLCIAAWTPNQTESEKDTNAAIIRDARVFLSQYS